MEKKIFYLLAFSPILGYLLYHIYSLPPYYFLGLFFFIVFILRIFQKKNLTILYRHSYLLILLFIYYLIWDMFNGRIDQLGIVKSIFKWDFNPLYVLAFLALIKNTSFDNRFIKSVIIIFKLTIILAAVVSIIQLFYHNFFVPKNFSSFYNKYDNIYENRRTSIFGFLGDNDLGLSFIPILSITIGYILSVREKKIFLWIILGGIVCILSNARYIMIGYLIVLFQILIFYRFKIQKLIIYILGFFLMSVILLSFIVNVAKYNIDSYYKQRITSKSAESRILAFDMMIKYLPRYPIFGNGKSLSNEIKKELAGRSSQIHVGFFSHMVTYGIFGSIFLFSFWYYLAKHLWLNAKRTRYYGSYFAFMVFIWANCVMVYYSIFTYGLIFAFIFDKYFSDKYIYNKLMYDRKKIQ